jgi:hypothetical protein
MIRLSRPRWHLARCAGTRRWRSWRPVSGVHPHQIYAWKKALTEAAPKVFAGRLGRGEELSERKLAELYEQVGRLMVERDFLLRRSGL